MLPFLSDDVNFLSSEENIKNAFMTISDQCTRDENRVNFKAIFSLRHDNVRATRRQGGHHNRGLEGVPGMSRLSSDS